MIPERNKEVMDAIKTYSAAIYAWVVVAWHTYLPNSLGEWTELFNMIAALLALILVALRFKHDIFRKKKQGDKSELE